MIDFKINVAGNIIRFRCDDPVPLYDPSDNMGLKNFLYSGTREEDIVFDIKYGPMPSFCGREVLFRGGEEWVRSKWNGNTLIEYMETRLPGRVDRAAVIGPDMRRGTIYVNAEMTGEEEAAARGIREARMTEEEKAQRMDRRAKRKAMAKSIVCKMPPEGVILGRRIMGDTRGRLFQSFIIEYLVKKRVGILVHSACIKAFGETHLYMGPSGAGKSTISRIFHENAGARVLNDDRAILIQDEGVIDFCNAPWAGDFAGRCDIDAEERVRIDRIFFIYHEKDNIARRVPDAEAVSYLFRNSFPVFWDKEDLDFVISLFKELVKSSRCYRLGFVRDGSVTGTIRKLIEVEDEDGME
ncbi:MAG: hypothetical protein WC515_02990 [Candidatus Omnitrophota bacterium]